MNWVRGPGIPLAVSRATSARSADSEHGGSVGAIGKYKRRRNAPAAVQWPWAAIGLGVLWTLGTVCHVGAIDVVDVVVLCGGDTFPTSGALDGLPVLPVSCVHLWVRFYFDAMHKRCCDSTGLLSEKRTSN